MNLFRQSIYLYLCIQNQVKILNVGQNIDQYCPILLFNIDAKILTALIGHAIAENLTLNNYLLV